MGDWVKMTNFPWEFSIEATRSALGFKSLNVINDFTTLALSLPFLPKDELVQVGGHQSIAGMPLSLIGPGTGLGVSGLIPGLRGRWTPVASEGGHASFSPSDEREMQLWQEGRKAFGHVSVERLLSGSGLQFIYRNLCRLANEPAHDYSPADISSKAIGDDCIQCRAALDAFCAMLGTAAANVTLTFGARGGAYIGGGIVPKLGNYFARSPFRNRFDQHGRLSAYLSPIPVFVITSKYPAFIGAAAFLDGLQDR
jgi:glucokinase